VSPSKKGIPDGGVFLSRPGSRFGSQAIEAHVRAHTHELANLTFTPLPFAAEPYFTSRDTAPNVAAAKVR